MDRLSTPASNARLRLMGVGLFMISFLYCLSAPLFAPVSWL
jgi:hypothetical protein